MRSHGRLARAVVLAAALLAAPVGAGIAAAGAAPGAPVTSYLVWATDGAPVLAAAAEGAGARATWLADLDAPLYKFLGTPAQAAALAALPGVVVEPDAPVQALLEGSVPTSGVAAAWKDFGVTGDLDGQPAASTKDVVVAVLDTGIDAGHPDLRDRIVGWADMVDGKPEAYDDQGHGTHVAGIVAGTGSKVRGVAPGAALVGVKVLDSKGSGSSSGIIEGIRWAVERKAELGIRVLSLSLGTNGCSDGQDALSKAVNWAVDQGLVVTVAAGNSGPAACTIGSPGAAEKVLTVGAARDPSEAGIIPAQFSSRGPTKDGRAKPDLMAPGQVLTSAKPGGGYVGLSGTSMATPFVAGGVALLLAAKPSLTPPQVKALLQDTAHDLGAAGRDAETGHGFLDLHAALRKATGKAAAPFHLPGHVAWAGEAADGGVQLALNVTGGPLGATVLAPTWGTRGPVVRLELLDASGQRVASAATDRARQATLLAEELRAGAYVLRVASEGGAAAVVDASSPKGLSAGAAPPQQPPQEPPQQPPQDPPPKPPGKPPAKPPAWPPARPPPAQPPQPPPDPAPPAPDDLVLRNLQARAVSPTALEVTWDTDVPATSEAAARSGFHRRTASDPGPATHHALRVEHLQAGRTYEVTATSAAGDAKGSAVVSVALPNGRTVLALEAGPGQGAIEAAATLRDGAGQPLAGHAVQFTVGRARAEAVTGEDGVAKVRLDAAPGVHAVGAYAPGKDGWRPAFGRVLVRVA